MDSVELPDRWTQRSLRQKKQSSQPPAYKERGKIPENMNPGIFEKMALQPKIKVSDDCGNSGSTGFSCP
ncbi:hypothetical protein H671_1g0158 [Cricetulus griseus]|nr:hypothetical protein H671_1g0158 [Cricetulus griseus]